MHILGNEKNLSFLKESAQSGHLSHAYMISGPEGSGKKTFARNAAAALLCENKEDGTDFAPCGYCASCKRALSFNHPDIIRVTHEKKNTLSVDEVRDEIVRDIDIRPYYGPYKIYIIEDAHLMPPQAQNALLKTIEEPPAYAVIFLLSDNADAFPDTIKSRSIRLNMQALSSTVIEEELKAKGADSSLAKKAAAFARGNLGLALEICKKEGAKESLEYIIKMLSEIKNADAPEIAQYSASLAESGFGKVTDTLRKWYRDVLVLKACGSGELFFPGQKETLLLQAESMSYENLNNIFKDLDEADERLSFNVNPKAVYEALLLRIRQNGKGYRNKIQE